MRFLIAATLWTLAVLVPWYFIVYSTGAGRMLNDLIPWR